MTERRSNINLKQLATTETKLMESQEKKKKPVKIGIHKDNQRIFWNIYHF